jgi:hypothetical protein
MFRRLSVNIHSRKIRNAAAFIALSVCLPLICFTSSVLASDGSETVKGKTTDKSEYSSYGGGYAASGQIPGIGFTTEIYDATNGLPTSDAMFLMSSSDGYIWIGGYAGVIRYDGTNFERLDTSDGLTSARAFLRTAKEGYGWGPMITELSLLKETRGPI